MKKLSVIILFGIFFGLLEAIVVVYLHIIIGKSLITVKNYHILLNLGVISFITSQNVILQSEKLNFIESVREGATIMMLLSLAYLAGNTYKQKFGAFLASFAMWDIWYYIFLRIFTGWPKTIFDIDVYFLIPVPWVGPVLTPLIVSFCMIFLGVWLFLSQ